MHYCGSISQTNVWRIYPGREEDRNRLLRVFIRERFIALGWPCLDLTNIEESEFLRIFKERSREYTGKDPESLRIFRYVMDVGDVVILMHDAKMWATGIIASDYYYREYPEPDYPQRRDVIWFWYSLNAPVELRDMFPSDVYRRLISFPDVKKPVLRINEFWRMLARNIFPIIYKNDTRKEEIRA